MIVEEVRKLIQEINLRVTKDDQKLNIEQLSEMLRETMEFKRQTMQRIEEFEKNGLEKDLVNYAKMICKNTSGREILEIQKFYFKKIDKQYLSSN